VIAAGRHRGSGRRRSGIPSRGFDGQVGTAYLLCPEASTSSVHRQAIASASARHTALTRLFTGRPARGIVNRLMREIDDGIAPAFPLATAAIAPLRAAAEAAAAAISRRSGVVRTQAAANGSSAAK
jgi:nitronate monooxygenase